MFIVLSVKRIEELVNMIGEKIDINKYSQMIKAMFQVIQIALRVNASTFVLLNERQKH